MGELNPGQLGPKASFANHCVMLPTSRFAIFRPLQIYVLGVMSWYPKAIIPFDSSSWTADSLRLSEDISNKKPKSNHYVPNAAQD